MLQRWPQSSRGQRPVYLHLTKALTRSKRTTAERRVAPVSSSGSGSVSDAGSSSLIGLETTEQLVAEGSTQRSDGLGRRVGGGLAFGNVRLSGSRTTDLRDSEPATLSRPRLSR
jgi:hypothetical protein